MESEERIIEKDREQHPDCHYSMSNRTSCSNNEEGKFVCDTMKQIFRHCAGKPAVSIYSSKVQQEPGQSDNRGGGPGGFPNIPDIFGGFFGSMDRNRPDVGHGLEDIFDQFQKEINRQFGPGAFQGRDGRQPLPPRLAPPPAASPYHDASPEDDFSGSWNVDPKKLPRGYLEGPPEDV